MKQMDLVYEGDIATDLIRGESEQRTVDERINDPLRYVDRFRMHRTRSVREVVHSAIAVCQGIDAVRDDSLQLGRFLIGLADAKVISKAEAAKADISKMSMISKIRKINEHRDIILHPKVADRICTGYSVLYELGLLIDALPDDGDAADQLGRHLETLDGALTRKWVQDLRESIAPKQRRAKTADVTAITDPIEEGLVDQVDTEEDVGGETASETDDISEDDTTSHNEPFLPENGEQADVLIADAGEPIAAALLIVGKQDQGILVHAAQENDWQRVADQMAEDSVVFVFAPMQLLLSISRVIETFGCDRCANVYLLSQPDKLEATKCNALAIFERGDGVFVEGVPNWTAEDTPFVIVEQLLQGVSGRRLQFFADAAVPGWGALTFDQE
jgi:hypothetical protein